MRLADALAEHQRIGDVFTQAQILPRRANVADSPVLIFIWSVQGSRCTLGRKVAEVISELKLAPKNVRTADAVWIESGSGTR